MLARSKKTASPAEASVPSLDLGKTIKFNDNSLKEAPVRTVHRARSRSELLTRRNTLAGGLKTSEDSIMLMAIEDGIKNSLKASLPNYISLKDISNKTAVTKVGNFSFDTELTLKEIVIGQIITKRNQGVISAELFNVFIEEKLSLYEKKLLLDKDNEPLWVWKKDENLDKYLWVKIKKESPDENKESIDDGPFVKLIIANFTWSIISALKESIEKYEDSFPTNKPKNVQSFLVSYFFNSASFKQAIKQLNTFILGPVSQVLNMSIIVNADDFESSLARDDFQRTTLNKTTGYINDKGVEVSVQEIKCLTKKIFETHKYLFCSDYLGKDTFKGSMDLFCSKFKNFALTMNKEESIDKALEALSETFTKIETQTIEKYLARLNKGFLKWPVSAPKTPRATKESGAALVSPRPSVSKEPEVALVSPRQPENSEGEFVNKLIQTLQADLKNKKDVLLRDERLKASSSPQAAPKEELKVEPIHITRALRHARSHARIDTSMLGTAFCPPEVSSPKIKGHNKVRPRSRSFNEAPIREAISK